MNKMQKFLMWAKTLRILVRHPVDSYHMMRMDKAGEFIEYFINKAARATDEEAIWHFEEKVDYWSFVWEDIWSEHLSDHSRAKVEIFGAALRMNHGWYLKAVDAIRYLRK